MEQKYPSASYLLPNFGGYSYKMNASRPAVVLQGTASSTHHSLDEQLDCSHAN